MKTTFAAKLLAVASACLLIAMPVRAANLIVNGDFETGSASFPNSAPAGGGWYTPWDAQNPPHARIGAPSALEDRSAVIDPPGPYYFAQNIPWSNPADHNTGDPSLGIVLGQQYTFSFSFFRHALLAGTLTVRSLGTDYVIDTWPHMDWYHLTYPVTAGGNLIRFTWSSPVGSAIWIDDVSLVPVPEPATVALLLPALGVGAFCRLRKSRPAGVRLRDPSSLAVSHLSETHSTAQRPQTMKTRLLASISCFVLAVPIASQTITNGSFEIGAVGGPQAFPY